MTQANGGTPASEPTSPTPDSDRFPEPRRRGTRCACGATRGLKPIGRWGVICPPCDRKRGPQVTQRVWP